MTDLASQTKFRRISLQQRIKQARKIMSLTGEDVPLFSLFLDIIESDDPGLDDLEAWERYLSLAVFEFGGGIDVQKSISPTS